MLIRLTARLLCAKQEWKRGELIFIDSMEQPVLMSYDTMHGQVECFSASVFQTDDF